MIFYKKPFLFNEDIENKDIKNIVEIFRNGNFNDAKKKLALIDNKNLNKTEKEEIDKLEKMLNMDKAGIFAVLFLLIVIMFLFMSY